MDQGEYERKCFYDEYLEVGEIMSAYKTFYLDVKDQIKKGQVDEGAND